MQDFLFLRKMLTRTFIQYIYWLWLAGAVIFGLVAAIALMSQGGFGIIVGPIAGLFVVAIHFIVARITCELLILGFEIHAELVAVRSVIAPPTGPQGFPVVPPPATPV